MSHRALVAVKLGPDTYNIYFSQNGAHELSLTEPLEEYVAGHTATLDAVADAELTRLPQLEQWTAAAADPTSPEWTINVRTADAPALTPEPMCRALSRDQLGYPIDFANIEAVYLVRDGGVETYVPIWMEPDVIRPWRDHLTVEVYRADQLPRDPRERLQARESTEPARVIDTTTFAASGWRDDATVDEVVTYHHEHLYALQRAMGTQDAPKGDTPTDAHAQIGQSHLATDDYDFFLHGPATDEIVPSPTGRGLLVRVPAEDLDAYWDVVHTANELRVDLGNRLHEQDAAGSEIDLRVARTALAKAILTAYRTRVASFSPDPYGSIVRKLTTTGAQSE